MTVVPPMRRLPTPLVFALLCVALGLTLIASAQAASDNPALRLRQDMQDCREGRTSQSRSDCEREARNAFADARRGALIMPVDEAAQRQRRCAVFKHEADHTDCMARLGAGAQLSGSVEGGGVLREFSIGVPAR